MSATSHDSQYQSFARPHSVSEVMSVKIFFFFKEKEWAESTQFIFLEPCDNCSGLRGIIAVFS